MSRPYGRALVGNWAEEASLREEKVKEFLQRKEAGELEVDKAQRVISNSTRRVKLQGHGDGVLHFGDVVQIAQVSTGFVLSALPPPPMTADAITECTAADGDNTPSLRNAFRIVPAGRGVAEDDESPVLYGDSRFYLVQAAGEEPLAMHTERLGLGGAGAARRNPKHQRVLFKPKGSPWVVQHPDPEFRVEHEGQPVTLDNEVLVVSATTNVPLACTDKRFRSDFGLVEHEVTCHNYITPRKVPGPEIRWLVRAGAED
eukprot:m.479307 g.479307  ORF g.479307 m.479307 type:complete len:258 (+) comp21398_c0_seq1:244-1017(+)